MKYILSLDQGTTSSRAILFGKSGEVVSKAQKEFRQYYPEAGWVEHDAEEIFQTQLDVAKEAMAKIGATASDIIAIGITNQRETTIVWDKNTGKPICPAIVWQCRRTSAYCDYLKEAGLTGVFQERTGLLIDAYFSATKLRWILENVPFARERAEKGELLFGTVDTWLAWKLSGGKSHITDVSNASRTMLFNIHDMEWDDIILAVLNIPKQMLPTVVDTSGHLAVCDEKFFGGEIPICAMVGDQQSALFGQCCFDEGDVKNTYGTGGFLLMNTGDTPINSKKGLLSTVAWRINGQTTYALEGSVFIAGALVQWLRDEIGLVKTSSETCEIAKSVTDSNGVYVVPAFVGLGAPYWNQDARGTICGLTRGSNRAHIIRACLEAIAFQTYDVLKAMESDSGKNLGAIKVDGGASANDFLMEFQADILSKTVVRPACVETTALGSALLAGIGAGVWNSFDELKKLTVNDKVFEPKMSEEYIKKLIHGWDKAIERSADWAD
ncbi:MAG: glycerol kinase GlpK [Oscillospiraceae bacterium]|nr:glycerol kinase GlpK [Oscillospiraceae bacterium]